MSTYIDPATALRIARNARADEIRSAERARLARTAKPRGGGSTRLLPSLDVVVVSQAPSPASNPDSPLPVITMVGT